MGEYTSIYFLPAAVSQWSPDAGFLRSVIQRIGVQTVYIFSGSSESAYWDNEDEGMVGPDLFFESNVPVESALQRWKAERPVVTHMSFHACLWSEQVSQYLWRTVSADIRGNYHPWSPNILVGPWSVCAESELMTVAKGTFYLSLSGDDSPNKSEQYHALLHTCPSVCEMLAWLQATTGFSWKTVLNVS